MKVNYLHHHTDFKDLLAIVAEQKSIDPYLVEKDYWIMHCLFGLQQLGLQFELKGGTSLSKAYKIIDRFSEDIDIHIHPDEALNINENPKNTNANNSQKRLDFFNTLANTIHIDGIIEVTRDTNFDDERYYRSGGIRLIYTSHFQPIPGIKEGILLEVGFDTVNPNTPIDISSWAVEKAQDSKVKIIDNKALQVPCYHIGYTFVEKLQTIATKYRNMIESGNYQVNFMRQYYDIFHLLQQQEVNNFIGTDEYHKHKENRFPKADYEIALAKNQAFLLENTDIRSKLAQHYSTSKGLYYNGQPEFESMLADIKKQLHRL